MSNVDKKNKLTNLTSQKSVKTLLVKFIVMKVQELVCVFAGHKDNNWLCHCERCNHITKGDQVIKEQLQREHFEKPGLSNDEEGDILPSMITKKHQGGKGKQAELRNRAVVILHKVDPEHFNTYQLSKLFERDWTTINRVVKLYSKKYTETK